MIEAEGLTKIYGNHKAVDGLSFKIGSNCVFGFLGPNGAGKSTTLNMITGCLSPSAGTVKINGTDMYEEPEKAKKYIGYLPEIPPVYEDMTPWEYLSFVAEAKKINKTEMKDKINAVMEETDITSMKNRLIKNLSKGYRQRVGIAQAILGDPEIIILDEPTVGLDPQQIIEIRELIKKLGKSHTVILSSHILTEISAVCDNIIIISHGKLIADDTTENLMGGKKGEKTVIMEVKGDCEKAKEILCQTEGVFSADAQPNENGLCLAKFTFKEENDPREEIFNSFGSAKMPIISSSVKKSSLEEIFLSLVHESFSENTPKEAEEK